MTTLANGVRVITETMPHVRSVSVGIWIGTGSRRETAGAERHLALHRAHAVQGHHQTLRRGDCALGGFHRRQPGRFHRQGTGVLQHQGAGPAPLPGLRRSGGPGAAPPVPRGGYRKRKGRHPGRDQDGGRQPGLPGARDLLLQLLEGPSAGQADSGHARDGQALRPRRHSELLPHGLLARQPAGDGRRQPDARAAWWRWCASISKTLPPGAAAAARRALPARTRASPCATRRRWSRCIFAWACRPIRCPTRSASPVTCSIRCWAAA